MSAQDDLLEQLVEAVLASSRYREVSGELIRDIGSRELARRTSLKEAVKAAKNKLHQVGGAYFTGTMHYGLWLSDLERLVQPGGRVDLLAYLKKIMSHHASTKERLPILGQFYSTILADLPPIHSVLDIACGLHPLALPWMPLVEPVEYYAYDMYQDMIRFLNGFLSLMQVQGQARVCNVVRACPTDKVDVAFVLKTLPCLEQVDRAASFRLLQAIRATYVVVSFPVYSLGGKAKGMEASYEARFRSLVEHHSTWSIKRFEFLTELAFLVTKRGDAPANGDQG
jgi:16S rRNA (guanine(1405)-N(7))-methyltransferase